MYPIWCIYCHLPTKNKVVGHCGMWAAECFWTHLANDFSGEVRRGEDCQYDKTKNEITKCAYAHKMHRLLSFVCSSWNFSKVLNTPMLSKETFRLLSAAMLSFCSQNQNTISHSLLSMMHTGVGLCCFSCFVIFSLRVGNMVYLVWETYNPISRSALQEPRLCNSSCSQITSSKHSLAFVVLTLESFFPSKKNMIERFQYSYKTQHLPAVHSHSISFLPSQASFTVKETTKVALW